MQQTMKPFPGLEGLSVVTALGQGQLPLVAGYCAEETLLKVTFGSNAEAADKAIVNKKLRDAEAEFLKPLTSSAYDALRITVRGDWTMASPMQGESTFAYLMCSATALTSVKS